MFISCILADMRRIINTAFLLCHTNMIFRLFECNTSFFFHFTDKERDAREVESLALIPTVGCSQADALENSS